MNSEAESLKDELSDLRSAYQAMMTQFLRIQQERKQLISEKQIILLNNESKLANQAAYFQALISDKDNRIQDLDQIVKRMESQDHQHTRRQVRKYVQEINQKQNQNSNLRRQLNSHKQKISSLEGELANAANVKENIDIFVIRGIDQLKSGHKEFLNMIQEADTEKMLLQSRYKQLGEKMGLMVENINQLKGKVSHYQEIYARLKLSLKESRDQCLGLKFQIEKVRQSVSRGEAVVERSEIMNSGEMLCLQELQKIHQMTQIFRNQEEFLRQVSQYKITVDQLMEENKQLRQRQNELMAEMDEIKCKLNSGYQDQMLKERQPSLYEFLLQKKNQLRRFQEHVDRIQNYISDRDQKISQILETTMNRQSSNRQSQIQALQDQISTIKKKCQFSNETNTRLKRQSGELERKIETYKGQIAELMGDAKKRKSNGKKRCGFCMLPYEKGDLGQGCSDCKKVFHQGCISHHKCEYFRMDDVTTHMTEFNQIA